MEVSKKSRCMAAACKRNKTPGNNTDKEGGDSNVQLLPEGTSRPFRWQNNCCSTSDSCAAPNPAPMSCFIVTCFCRPAKWRGWNLHHADTCSLLLLWGAHGKLQMVWDEQSQGTLRGNANSKPGKPTAHGTGTLSQSTTQQRGQLHETALITLPTQAPATRVASQLQCTRQ